MKVLARGLAINFQTDTFTGDGTTTVFTLTQLPYSSGSLLVFIDGIFVAPSAYSASSTSLTITTAPAVSQDVLVWYMRNT